MLRNTIVRFASLRPPVKAMVFLFWLYMFATTLTGLFVQLFVYDKFHDLATNIIAVLLEFAGVMIGFCLIGSVFAALRLNMKYGYASALLLMASSFHFLYGEVSFQDAMLFMLVNGMGNGIYWLAIHTFELTETKSYEREFYSAMLSMGTQVVGLLAPLLGTVLLYLSDFIFNHTSYAPLFVFAPLCHILGFPFIKKINDYRPQPILRRDVRHFFAVERHRFAQLYMAGDSLAYTWETSLIPVTSLLLLHDAKLVGAFTSVFALISVLVIMMISYLRKDHDRIGLLAFTTLLLAALAVLPAVSFTLGAFIVFTFGLTLIKPLYRVSAHVIDLEMAETLAHQHSDFFPTMILRNISLWVWRAFASVTLLVVIRMTPDSITALRFGFLLLVLAPVITLLGALLLYKRLRLGTRK